MARQAASHPGALLDVDRQRLERAVELGGEPGGQGRCALRAAATDDDRDGSLHRLGQAGRVDHLVVAAAEAEAVAVTAWPTGR